MTLWDVIRPPPKLTMMCWFSSCSTFLNALRSLPCSFAVPRGLSFVCWMVLIFWMGHKHHCYCFGMNTMPVNGCFRHFTHDLYSFSFGRFCAVRTSARGVMLLVHNLLITAFFRRQDSQCSENEHEANAKHNPAQRTHRHTPGKIPCLRMCP